MPCVEQGDHVPCAIYWFINLLIIYWFITTEQVLNKGPHVYKSIHFKVLNPFQGRRISLNQKNLRKTTHTYTQRERKRNCSAQQCTHTHKYRDRVPSTDADELDLVHEKEEDHLSRVPVWVRCTEKEEEEKRRARANREEKRRANRLAIWLCRHSPTAAVWRGERTIWGFWVKS